MKLIYNSKPIIKEGKDKISQTYYRKNTISVEGRREWIGMGKNRVQVHLLGSFSHLFYLDYNIYIRDLFSFGNFVPLNLDSIKHMKDQF